MDSIEENTIGWFTMQPRWVALAAEAFLADGAPRIWELIRITINEVRKKPYRGDKVNILIDCASQRQKRVTIESIGNIKGVNRMSTTLPLTFGSEAMSVVYGLNGAGKTGYVRLIRAMSKGCEANPLLGDVFSPVATKKSCEVNYVIDGERRSCAWNDSKGALSDLVATDIFDAGRGLLYISQDNEVEYEPPTLALFSQLVSVAEIAQKKVDGMKKELPEIDLEPNICSTSIYLRLKSVLGTEKFKDFLAELSWTSDDDRELSEKFARLSEKSLSERISILKSRKNFLSELLSEVDHVMLHLSQEGYDRLVDAREQADIKRRAAEAAASNLFSETARLEGIGSKEWIELWMAAKKYASMRAYQGKEYPSKDEGIRCVLCHQVLDFDAKKRMMDFEKFVKGVSRTEAKNAQAAVEQMVLALPRAWDDKTLQAKMAAAGISEESEKRILRSFNSCVIARRKAFEDGTFKDSDNKLPDMTNWIKCVKDRLRLLTSDISTMELDMEKGDGGRIELQKSYDELQARKALFLNRRSMCRRHMCTRRNQLLDEVKRRFSTTKLTSKKSELAELLITDAFARRFDRELRALSSGRIHVSLVKSKATKGRILHRITLGTPVSAELRDILSEGEARIVSLAAFIADSEGNQSKTPFVFDDPISSLDQEYEEAVAQRLIALSEWRQVIVFTHRLSLIGTLRHYLKKAGKKASFMSIRAFSGATGVVADLPIASSDIKTSLNKLRDQRLSLCKRLREEQKVDEYEMAVKGVCSDFRVLVERSVETDLLWGIVERFSRPVSTLKIPQLEKMKSGDWKVLDSLMTKYSGFEHSQPLEAPIRLPTVEEICKDINELIEWREEYTKRK